MSNMNPEYSRLNYFPNLKRILFLLSSISPKKDLISCSSNVSSSMQIRRSLIILIYIPKILCKVLLGYIGHMVIFKILERSKTFTIHFNSLLNIHQT